MGNILNFLSLYSEYRYILLTAFLTGIMVSFTLSSIYESFGPNAKELRDPFEEHED